MTARRATFRSSRALLLALALPLLLAAACSSDDVIAPPPPVEGTMTVDAASGWAFVDLESGDVVTPTPSSSESEAWDIAFSVTSVMLNGGLAGPGGVAGYCVCQNETATNEQVLAMTAASELADFEGVTSVPAGITWIEEELTPAFSGWYTGSGATAAADPAKVFLVRLADGESYAKLRVADLEDPTAAAPGTITFEYAVQPTSADEFGPTLAEVVTVNASSTILLDLDAEDGVPIGEGWDLRIDGWNVTLNGGPSGAGEAGVIPTTDAFEEITTAYVEGVSYATDRYAGVFGEHPWYRYNIQGDHRVSPTFDVYLVKRGASVYKVQLLDYYGTTGAPRQISFRYERIAP